MGAIMFLGGQSYAQVPSYVPTNGLVGWWPFNGNANDESGNGNNGTVNGATLTTDRFGVASKAYSFDANKILVNNNPSLNLQGGFTFNCWVLLNGNTSDNTIISKYQNFDDSYSFVVKNLKPTIQTASSPANWSICQNTNTLNQNVWINLAASFDTLTNEFKIYKNGVLIHQCINNSSIALSNANVYFGSFSNGNYFYGKIDDIGIWNRAINDQEILNLYNSCSLQTSISPSFSSVITGGSNSLNLTTSDISASITWQSNASGLGWVNILDNNYYSGSSSSILTINNVQLWNNNQAFRVISSNPDCSDTSNIATIQIADTCITNVTVYDTLTTTIYDTTYVTVYDTLLTTVTDTLIINTTLSLPAPNNENTILIYPNPASDHITIDNGNFAAMAGYSIKIENNAGQQVFQSAINQAQFYVDLSTWTGNGLYFVHLIDPQNNTVTVRKIVLQ
jgi:hypothetical protein